MTQEEKAKAYDEALEKAKGVIEQNPLMEYLKKGIEYILPELMESEDEKIRKELKSLFLGWINGSNPPLFAEECNRWISWLEKQGKPIDNIVKRAMTEKQRILLTETNGDANIDWDTRSLKDAITLLKHGLNRLQEIEVKKQTMPSSRFGGCSEYNPTRFDKEKQGKQGEQNLPSFDESQGTPILKQVEQKSIDNLTPLEAMNIAIAKCFDEQKPADNDGPKFKVGDWVVDKNGIVKQILSYKDGVYKHTNGYSSKMFEDEWRIWDITKDAKDGDVLHCWIDGDEFILIYKGVKDGYITTYGHLYQKFKLFSEEPTTMFCRTIQGHFTPATEEQCELLFQKIKEAGYEWNAEKRELRKIEQKSAEWSKEDEKERRRVVGLLEGWLSTFKETCYAEDCKRGINWLKSLRPHKQWKPSDEQIEALLKLEAMHVLEHEKNQENAHLYMVVKSLREQLLKLREE